jgi:hypothetical protein
MPISVASSEAIAIDVSCSDDALTVVLDDGRTVSVPLVWFPRLLNATEKQRKEWEFIGGGIGIHWEEIDEDISIASLLNPDKFMRLANHAMQPTPLQRFPRLAKNARLGAVDRKAVRPSPIGRPPCARYLIVAQLAGLSSECRTTRDEVARPFILLEGEEC